MAQSKISNKIEPLFKNSDLLDLTKLDIETFSHSWDLPLFMTLNIGECLEEAVPTDGKSCASWYLQVYPNGKDGDSKDYVSVFLQCFIGSATAQYVIELLDSSNNVLFCGFSEFTRFAENSEKGYLHCIKRDTLQKALEKSFNGTLTIICTINEFTGIENDEQLSCLPIKEPKGAHSTYVMKTLLTDQVYTDFTINVGRRQFKVHKAVLYTCSPVFATMFSTEMKEREENEATVDDVEPDIFEKIVEFIYTGSVASIDVDAMELVPVAHKYDLKALLEQCEAVLCFQISMESAVKMLVLSSVYTLKYLKNISIKYIKVNLEAVAQTADFKTYVENDPKLLMMLLMH